MVSTSPKNILIIDDEESIILLFRTILDVYGYNTHYLITSENVLPAVEILKPDLIVLDVSMPDKDGYEVCRELKGHKATKHIPIIMITALSLDQDKKKGFECGTDAFLFKPFDAVFMINEIRRLTNR